MEGYDQDDAAVLSSVQFHRNAALAARAAAAESVVRQVAIEGQAPAGYTRDEAVEDALAAEESIMDGYGKSDLEEEAERIRLARHRRQMIAAGASYPVA